MEEEEEVEEEAMKEEEEVGLSHGRGGGWKVAEETIIFPGLM